MNNINLCLDQIKKVQQVGSEEEVAYVARSRIGRLILNVLRLICKTVDASPPNRPGPIQVPLGADEHLRSLINICNHLNETAKTITQPSEPLDERWRAGWSELQSDLIMLEKSLTQMKMKSLK